MPLGTRVLLAASFVEAVSIDTFLAHLFIDSDLVGHDVFVDAAPFHWDGFLLHGGAFFMEDDLGLLLAGVGADRSIRWTLDTEVVRADPNRKPGRATGGRHTSVVSGQ